MYRTHTFAGRYVHPQTRQEYKYEASYHGDRRVAWSVKIQTGSCFSFINSGVIHCDKLSEKAMDDMVKSAVEAGILEMPPRRFNRAVGRPMPHAFAYS